ncbi:hypothetical protein BDZ89DRAFT_1141869 [Hymenopellis radicata]|nr:hypothetical protein BDZ89DRAFT_1141869 [Hymenopellis radicata]
MTCSNSSHCASYTHTTCSNGSHCTWCTPILFFVSIAKPVLHPARFDPFDDPVDLTNLSLHPANLDEFIEHCTTDAAVRKAWRPSYSGRSILKI